MEKKMAAAGAVFAACLAAFAADVPLEKAFIDPSPEARPHTWWHWMNGNVSKDGISEDLAAMARAGIGGVQIFDAGLAIPSGPVAFGTDAWIDHVVHAIREAGRYGIEVVLSNCSGWSSTGGPWVTPDDAMKIVACSKLEVEGPCRFDADLPVPAAAGTVEAIAEAKAKLESGELKVFDTSKFTVEGKALESYLADVDTDDAFTPDTEVIKDGYFAESTLRSAPYFDIRIDGIKELN